MSMALLDHIEVAGFTASYTVWENGLRGAICDIDHDCIYRFVEVTEDGAYYKYKESEWKEKCPIVAVGIIAWWFKYRRTQEGIASIYESYYQMRLGQYRDKRKKEPDSWKANIEKEYLEKHFPHDENQWIKRSEAVLEYFAPEEVQTIKSIANNYILYVEINKLNLNTKDMKEITKNNTNITSDSSELTDDEWAVLNFLSDGKEHFNEPDIDDYCNICDYLAELGLVELGDTKDDGISLSYQGKRLIKIMKKQQQEEMNEIDFRLLRVIYDHEKEIDPKVLGAPQVYDFMKEFFYTPDEITQSSQRLKEKGWIDYFIDGGPAYWHRIKDAGIVALRNYLKQHSEQVDHPLSLNPDNNIVNDEELINSLLNCFYQNRQNVMDYISKIRSISKNPEIVAYTADLVNQGIISKLSCRNDLWKPLHNKGLYEPQVGTWNKQMKVLIK